MIEGGGLPSWFNPLVYLSYAAEVAGLSVGVYRWRHLDLPRRLLTIWLSVGVCGDLAEQYWRFTAQNTQLVGQIWNLFSGAIGLLVIASMQNQKSRKKRFRYAAAVYVITWIVLMLTAETVGEYSRFIDVIFALSLMIGSAITIAFRGLFARRDLWRDPSFMISAGLMVCATPTAMQSILARALMEEYPHEVVLFYGLRAAINALGLLIVLWALTIRDRNAPELGLELKRAA